MKPNYSDIINVAGVPLWYDEHGVPRYLEFNPRALANPGADECALLTIQCQRCNHQFKVAKSWSKYDWLDSDVKLKRITEGELAYGDPPNIGCCSAGHTMSSELVSIDSLLVRDPKTYIWEYLPHELCKKLYEQQLIDRVTEDDLD